MTGARLTPRTTLARRLRRGAFTMIEMVTSCAILSLLMLALGYGLKIAIVSTGNGAAQAAATIEATAVVERVTDDMNEALDFTEKTSESVTFTVPSRGATTQPGVTLPPDEIRYKWWPAGGTFETGLGGLVGGLLGGLTPGPTATSQTVPDWAVTRQVNGGTPSVLARDVRRFKLDYLYRSMSPPVVAPDRLLLEHNPGLGLGTLTEFQVNTSRWMGVSFKMPLAGDVTSFAITRATIYLRADATLDGLLLVRVYPANAVNNTPDMSSAPLDEVWVPEIALTGSLQYVEVPFTRLTNLNPNQKYCVLVSGTGAAGNYHSIAGYMRYLVPPLSSVLVPNTYLVQTTTGAAPWTTSSLNSLRYQIYGTTTSQ